MSGSAIVKVASHRKWVSLQIVSAVMFKMAIYATLLDDIAWRNGLEPLKAELPTCRSKLVKHYGAK